MYTVTAHVSSVVSVERDLTVKLPWAYIIVVPRHKIIYAGETFDQGGLVARMSAHFGPYPTSTLRQCAARHAGISRVRSPFIVFAACLPNGEDEAPFEGGSLLVRRRVEATIHELIVKRFATRRAGWVLVSSTSPTEAQLTTEMEVACESIYECFEQGVLFLRDLCEATPWTFVLLDRKPVGLGRGEPNAGEIFAQIEVQVFEWVLSLLKAGLGESWWTDGIPEAVRIQCATRREQEGGSERIPLEAYLTLIDFRDIVRKNWKYCSSAMERISTIQGKDNATQWIVELNEMRKLWAHPIKQRFFPVEPAQFLKLKNIQNRVSDALRT